MNPHRHLSVAIFWMLLLSHASASVFYVDLNSTNPAPPYAAWNTAATNIQDAVDASTNGDLVLVTNGVYQTGGRVAGGLTNRVAVTKAVTVQSVNGPQVTVIQGYQVPGATNGTNAIRCAFLTNNAALTGFTLTNGATHPFFAAAGLPSTFGGGVFCNASSAILSNCIIIGNSAGDNGGGAESGTLNNCTLAGNTSTWGGGAYGSTLINCLVVSNNAGFTGGGVYGCTVNDCLVIGNFVTNNGGNGGGSFGSTLNNCTLAGNSASSAGGAVNGILNNCIVYYNGGGNYGSQFSSINLNHCCTTPLPGGLGNITNEPVFVNPTNGDYHLQSNSPCINSGGNAQVAGGTDLDGNPRIVGGTVDIGAYEYQTPTSFISYAWLQQYDLPTDGSADYSDTDGTGMENWQKWIAGLNPINPASVLAMVVPVVTNSSIGVTVDWQSVNTRTYYLQRSTNLAGQPAFSTIQSNILGQTGTTSYTDGTATNSGPYFYRVGVQ